ncbi:hypothetical protein L7F22_060768 [Adiantum nelumboides]|nr:hypothetical protein [Adiantum nelumboides]
MPLGSSWPARNLSYLASPANAFCFGWLQFPSASQKFYVAVWYAALDNAVVWAANRDAPASADDILQLTVDGNLLIRNSTAASIFSLRIWETNTTGVSALQVLDSGNVVLLLQNKSSLYAWQSFSFPTDTLLPSQSLFLRTSILISRPPAFSTSLASGNFLSYTQTDVLSVYHIEAASSSNSISISEVWQAGKRIVFLDVGRINSSVIAGQFLQNGIFIVYNTTTGDAYSQFVPSDYGIASPANREEPIYRRLTLDSDGNLRMYGWNYVSGMWAVLFEAISDLCWTMSTTAVAICGPYGVCVDAPKPACACPPGFHPSDASDVSAGCSPDSLPLPSCQNNNQSTMINASGISYLVLQNTDFYGNDMSSGSGIALADCQGQCTKSCSCVGVIYDHSGSATCWLKQRFVNGYSPQRQAGTRDAFLKLWNSTISPVINPPSQSPALVWINSSAFWSLASPQTMNNINATTSCSNPPAATSNDTSSCSPPSYSADNYSKHRPYMSVLTVSVISAGELLCFLLALFLLIKTNVCPLHGREVSPLQDAGCRAFTYAELVEATNDFRHPLGSGAFGAVVKGVLADGREVAVKRLQTSLLQLADTQFRAEIATLGRIHHMNLLRLYGYCAEGPDRRLLVYEYMEKGSLNTFLFEEVQERAAGRRGGTGVAGEQAGSAGAAIDVDAPRSAGSRVLDWSTRYNICLGTARGLAYLHEECLDCIVHCDIKPENILLDKGFCPKVADFGLAYLFGRNETLEVSNVRGTRGYLAPEWLSYMPITAKADVFSYGMVLIEIVSGRRNFRFTLSAMAAGRWEYPSWALEQVQNGRVEEVVDPKIRGVGTVDYEEAEKVLKIAFLCLHREPTARPSMRSIVQMLEGSVPVPVLPHGPGSLREQVTETAGGPDHDDSYLQGPHFTSSMATMSLPSGR